MSDYVHGYTEREQERLHDQAGTLETLLHHDTGFPPGARVLEVGAGVGATTRIVAGRSPGAWLLAVDRDGASLGRARRYVGQALPRAAVRFLRADLYRLPLPAAAFDHVFVCFLLEHLPEPARALERILSALRPGGTFTAVEGDHGSCYFHPETDAARRAWQCLIDVQARLGGDSLIGRRLYPLLTGAGLREVRVSPRMVYCDPSRPGWMDGFVKRTIIPMVEGVRDRALAWGLTDEAAWRRGIADLYRSGEGPEGTFCYTFFKGTGVK